MDTKKFILGECIHAKNADVILQKVYEGARKIYGNAADNVSIQERLNEELKAILLYGLENLFLHALDIVQAVHSKGYKTGFRGTLGSSFVAFLLGLTEMNPLPHHYYCKECGYVEFTNGVNCDDKFLENKGCPKCHRTLESDGYNLPSCFFISPWHNEVPNIYIDIPCTILKESGLSQVELYADNGDAKLMVCGLSCLDMFYEIEKKTQVSPKDIPLNDAEVYLSFQESGIQGFHRENTEEIIRILNPQNFSELTNVCGVLSSAGVWDNNDTKFLTDNRHNLSSIGTLREDIFASVMSYGITEKDAFEITKKIIRGRLCKKDEESMKILQLLRSKSVPERYINYLTKIRYLYPKSKALYDAQNIVKLAWYKLKFPQEYKQVKC